jgi:hypothetical protein
MRGSFSAADRVSSREPAWDPNRVQGIDHQQPRHALGVARVGLDAVLGGRFDLARRRHDAADPALEQGARRP